MDCDTHWRVGISRLHFPVTTLGPGRRVGIWLQGCSIRCPGCLSLDTWPAPEPSQFVDIPTIVRWIASQLEHGASGLTITGGEPLDQAESLEALLGAVREARQLDDLDILLYSGYTMPVLRRRHPEILTLVDAVMSGPFLAGRPTTIPWRGSSNQRLALLTERARDRFGFRGPSPRIQVGVDGEGIWIVGVPTSEDLVELENRLQDRGVRLEDVSWRL